jgi:hypothetical protein
MRRSDVWGWGLFVVCALVFVGDAIRDRDPLMTLGSLLFLVACFCFLAPEFAARWTSHRGVAQDEVQMDGDGSNERAGHRNEEPV